MANSSVVLLTQLAQAPGNRIEVAMPSAKSIYMENRSGDAMYVQTYALDGSEDLGFILDPQEWRQVTTATGLYRIDLVDLVLSSFQSIPRQGQALASQIPPADIVSGQLVFLTWSSGAFGLTGGPRVIGANVAPNFAQQATGAGGGSVVTLDCQQPGVPFSVAGPFTAFKMVNTNATTNCWFILDGGAHIPIGVGSSIELDNINCQTIGMQSGGGGCSVIAYQYVR